MPRPLESCPPAHAQACTPGCSQPKNGPSSLLSGNLLAVGGLAGCNGNGVELGKAPWKSRKVLSKVGYCPRSTSLVPWVPLPEHFTSTSLL